jgi:hypothetical protein
MKMATWMISGVLGFIAGGALIWFGRTTIERMVIGGNALSAKLHAKADALRK